jgi:hypothetical protein
MRFQPECRSHERRIHAGFQPPTRLVAATMSLPMMSSAQRDGELIADFASKGPALGKSQVVSIRRLSAAD